jgi:hypothetical protein
VKKFSGLKGFIARALFMFLIAVITSSHPIYNVELYEKVQGDDDAAANGDDAAADGDDADGGGDDTYYYQAYDPSADIPSSAVNFQMVTAFVL